jgi:hypothetical protein
MYRSAICPSAHRRLGDRGGGMSTVHASQVEVLPDCVLVTDLAITDERAISLVRRAGDEAAAGALLNMISVGATGLEAMSDAQHLDFVREQVSGLMVKTEREVDRLGERLARQADEKFDPAQPGSYSHQIACEVDRARVELTRALQQAVAQIREDEAKLQRALDGTLNPSVQGSSTQLAVQAIQEILAKVASDFDPANKNGHAARLASQLEAYSAVGGPFEARLKSELKVAQSEIVEELRSVRDVVVREQTVKATKPTVIGDNFEAAVEEALAHVARHADGDWLQNVSREIGEATDAKSGDFDYHLAGGGVVAIEARNRQGKITLGGKTGVLEELKRAKANRKADFAVYCVASEEALPDQVGYLQRYDDRIICCFGAHGEILALAVKFARLCLMQRQHIPNGANADTARAAIEDIQRKVATLAAVKRWCSNISESADKIRAHVGSVMVEVSETAERAVAALRSPE